MGICSVHRSTAKKLTENQVVKIIEDKTMKAAGFKSRKGTKSEAKMRFSKDSNRTESVWD